MTERRDGTPGLAVSSADDRVGPSARKFAATEHRFENRATLGGPLSQHLGHLAKVVRSLKWLPGMIGIVHPISRRRPTSAREPGRVLVRLTGMCSLP